MSPTAWKNVPAGYPAISRGIRELRWPVIQSRPTATPLRLPELSANAAEILGDNGVARFREFSSYREGWDFGHGLPLSPGSIANLERFLESYNRFQRRPSLFFTRQGHLALGWEDADECDIELELAPGHFILYLASSDKEITIDREDLPSLLAILP